MEVFNFFLNLGQNYGAMGIFIGTFLESIGIPFVGTSLTLTSGSLIASGKVSFVGVVLAGTLGNVSGSIISYGIGYYLGGAIRKLKKGHISENDDKIKNFIKKYGPISVLLGQLYGTTRAYISIPAGMMKMSFKKFVLYTMYGGIAFSIVVTLFSFVIRNAYYDFVYPYIGISFGLAAILCMLFFIITHFTIRYASRVSKSFADFFSIDLDIK